MLHYFFLSVNVQKHRVGVPFCKKAAWNEAHELEFNYPGGSPPTQNSLWFAETQRRALQWDNSLL